jgi:hypothetical protein
MHLSSDRLLYLIIFSQAALFSAAHGWALKFYSDTNCNNYIGEDYGPNDEQSLAWNFIECSNSPVAGRVGGAKSFKMWNEPCTLARVQFGGQRVFSADCPMFYCQNGFMRTSVYGDHSACYNYDDMEIKGWWIIYNYSACRKRDGGELDNGNSTTVGTIDARDAEEYADAIIEARQQTCH